MPSVALGLFDVTSDPHWDHILAGVNTNLVRQLSDDLINKEAEVTTESRVYKWGSTAAAHPGWDPPDDWLQHLSLDHSFTNDLPSLVDSIRKHQVVCIEAPTGTGKSTIIPGIVYEANKRALRDGECEGFDPGVGQRIIHLMPSGEQVHQTHDHVSAEYLRKAGFECGAYSSALSSRGADNNHVEEGVTNYVFSTYFFAEHALHGNHLLHTVVIDEIHDVTVTVMHLLKLVKTKLLCNEVHRVVLLTATLSSDLRNRLRHYFTHATNTDLLSIHFMNPGRPPHPITVVHENDDVHSQRGFSNMNGPTNYSNERLHNPQVDSSEHEPNVDTLMGRALRTLKSHLEPYERGQSIPEKPPGFVVFLPGAQDVIRAKIRFQTMLREDFPFLYRGHHVDVYNVTGQERNDVGALSEANNNCIRVCFSTPILSTGVTLSGINTVIDTGIRKIPSSANRTGIYGLITLWQDKNSRDQRKGRVGRVAAGTVYQCFSKRAHDEMTVRDHTIRLLQSGFNSSILPPALSFTYDFLIQPDAQIIEELILEAGTYGMLRTRVFSEFYCPVGNPRIDAVGVALSRCFKELPLDMGVFLLYCCANKCILPGLALIASYLARHSILAKPSKNTFGRDNVNYSLNAWPGISGCPTDSDMAVYADFLMNVLLFETRASRRHAFYPSLPFQCRSMITTEGTTETVVVFHALLAGLNSLGVATYNDYWRPENSGVVMVPDENEEYTYAHMDEKTACRFNVCLLAAFGHRVMKLSSDGQKNIKHDIYTVPGVIRNGQQIRVQGERTRMQKLPLVVFCNIFDYNPIEPICTTHLHQFTTVDYLLYGNAHGATTDVLDFSAKTLVIQTNTGSLQFRFDSINLMQKIIIFRKAMKLVPGALLLPGHGDHVTTMRDLIDRMPIPQTTVVEYQTPQPTFVPIIHNVAFFIPPPPNVPPPIVPPRNGN